MISNTVVVAMIHDLRIHFSEVGALLREHTIKYICKEVTVEKLFLKIPPSFPKTRSRRTLKVKKYLLTFLLSSTVRKASFHQSSCVFKLVTIQVI